MKFEYHNPTRLVFGAGCPTRLSELGIDDQFIETYAKETLRIIHDERGLLPARPAMSEADTVGVLRAAL